jgi:hypothetical protein
VKNEGHHGIVDLKRLLWNYFTSIIIHTIEARMGGAARLGT